MEEHQNNKSHLSGDLLTLTIVVGLFTIILTSVFYLDNNSNIITDLGKKIAGLVIK